MLVLIGNVAMWFLDNLLERTFSVLDAVVLGMLIEINPVWYIWLTIWVCSGLITMVYNA